jgi:hypothetical protein
VNTPNEPLELSAALVRRLAPLLCRQETGASTTCEWYHGLWQDLRRFGLAAAPEHQAEFFHAAFERLSTRGRLRVLIIGAADYSILAHVLWACQSTSLTADITVVDACATPLFLNKWYSEQVQQPVITVQSTVDAFRPSTPFDLICSHSFLGQFPAAARGQLLRTWVSWLAPGGALLTINRVRSEDAPEEIGFTPEQAAAFCATLDQRLEGSGMDPAEQDTIRDRSRIYVARRRAHRLTGPGLTDQLVDAGLRIDSCSEIPPGEFSSAKDAGPGRPDGARHACILAFEEVNQTPA